MEFIDSLLGLLSALVVFLAALVQLATAKEKHQQTPAREKPESEEKTRKSGPASHRKSRS